MSATELLAQARIRLRHDRAEGIRAFRDLTTRYPNYADGWFERSGAENSNRHCLTAIDSGKRALELAPGNQLYRAHLAQLQVSYGLWGDGLRTLRPLLDDSFSNHDPRIINGVGAVLSLAGLEAEAQPWFERAVNAAPAQRNYQFNLAQGLLHCGHFEESSAAFDRLLRAFPDFAKGYWSLASLKGKNADDQQLAKLRQALTRAASPSDEVYYCFALFTLLDALDRREEAFAELEHGLKLQRALIRYSGEDAALLRTLAGISGNTPLPIDEAGSDGPDDAVPIFIVGLPRSGTTLVERIISNHPDVAQGGEFVCFSAALRERFGIEIPGFFPQQLAAALTDDPPLGDVGARYLDLTTYKRQGHKFFTDKLPFNFMLLPWIARALPRARFVHVQRDPMDTCFSNLKQLFSHHYAACYSQLDMGEYYLAYDELMKAWDRFLPGRILQVQYEQLVSDPEDGSRRLFEFCGISQHEKAWQIELNTKPVATASAVQVRDPINARSVGAWRRYEKQLQPLAEYIQRHVQVTT